jgi:hypothetical protein
LINPAVIDQLQPFIVTAWHGHRNDAEIPPAVRDVWREKFDRQRGPGPQQRMQSNVDLAILDSSGRLVHWFDGMPRNRGSRGSLAQYTARELQRAADWLKLDDRPTKRLPVKLPDLEDSRGVRIFVSLKDDRMRAYQAPVVEVVPLTAEDWTPLTYPKEKRRVPAAALTKWLSQVYPPGVMERTNPRTKLVYKIKTVEGELSLAPAGSDNSHRFALLSGTVQLTDEGPDKFSFEGRLEVVLTYTLDDAGVQGLRGVFDGIYPRYDRMHDRTRYLPLQAAFESRPESLSK